MLFAVSSVSSQKQLRILTRLRLTERHRGCVTPKQIHNWKELSDGDPELMDGLEDLPHDMQEKVKRAVEQGKKMIISKVSKHIKEVNQATLMMRIGEE